MWGNLKEQGSKACGYLGEDKAICISALREQQGLRTGLCLDNSRENRMAKLADLEWSGNSAEQEIEVINVDKFRPLKAFPFIQCDMERHFESLNERNETID